LPSFAIVNQKLYEIVFLKRRESMALFPWFSGGDGGPGLTRIIHIIFGILVGALMGGVIAAAFDEFPKNLSSFVLDGCIVGAWLGWIFDGSSQSGNAKPTKLTSRAAGPATRLDERYIHADYPDWLITLFAVSLGAFIVGFLSALYIAMVGFSTIALAGTYLIPLGLTALYYLLGAAEQRS
jgi:hypothetical protein